MTTFQPSDAPLSLSNNQFRNIQSATSLESLSSSRRVRLSVQSERLSRRATSYVRRTGRRLSCCVPISSTSAVNGEASSPVSVMWTISFAGHPHTHVHLSELNTVHTSYRSSEDSDTPSKLQAPSKPWGGHEIAAHPAFTATSPNCSTQRTSSRLPDRSAGPFEMPFHLQQLLSSSARVHVEALEMAVASQTSTAWRWADTLLRAIQARGLRDIV